MSYYIELIVNGGCIVKAIWNDQVIAEADKDDLIYIEQNWYFPPSSVKQEFLEKSPTPYTCPWKGVCQYFNIKQGDKVSQDNAWSYPEPYPSGIEKVHKDFSNYVAFWRDVRVVEDSAEPAAEPELEAV
jgi:uncharacterized protein (DUF427 family)